MVGVERIDGGPRSVIVVGAGIVGLSTAWFLQERGVEVTVVDRTGVAAGASWGNAGWIAPGLTLPLNSPGILRHGLRALRKPTAPLHIPLTADIGHRVFLSQFLAHCQRSSWKRAMRANVALNEDCIEAFDVLIANGVDAPVTDAPITALFRTTREAEHMLWQLGAARKGGPANVCHRIIGRSVTRASTPGIAGDHCRARTSTRSASSTRADSWKPWAAQWWTAGPRYAGWKSATYSAQTAASRCTRAAARR